MMDTRTPPHAPEAEQNVLGAMLSGGMEAVGEAVGIVSPDDFYAERHRIICRAVMAVYERGDAIDATTVSAQIRQVGSLEKVGGLPYLSDLLTGVPTAANIAYHAKVVADRARRRRLIAAAASVTRDAYESADDTAVVLDRAERAVMAVAEARGQGRLTWIKHALGPTFEEIEKRQQSKDGITGVPTGLTDLDAMTGGLQPGDLDILAARPSMGKTALAVGMGLNVALKSKRPVALFSLEMSKVQMSQRMLAHEGIVDLSRLMRGGLQDDDYARIATASSVLNSAPIWVDDNMTGTVMDIRAKARRLKAEHDDLGLIVVDYLQLMDGKGAENRNQEVGEITRGLKKLAIELDVAVLALSQLSRKVEERAVKRPILSDLRDSGSLEQDADVVMFLYRPEYYLTPAKADEEDVVNRAELIIAKQRNGPTGSVDLFFRKECARFEDFKDGGRPGW